MELGSWEPGYWALAISVAVLLAVIAAAFKFGNWQGEVNSDRKRFDKLVEEIRKDIKEIRKDIKEIFGRLPLSSTTSESPVRLTTLGERISENIGAKSWAVKHAKDIIDETKGMHPLEVQELPFKIAREFEPEESLLKKMRDSAFQEGINLEGVRNVLAVELRDCLLNRNNLTKSSFDN